MHMKALFPIGLWNQKTPILLPAFLPSNCLHFFAWRLDKKTSNNPLVDHPPCNLRCSPHPQHSGIRSTLSLDPSVGQHPSTRFPIQHNEDPNWTWLQVATPNPTNQTLNSGFYPHYVLLFFLKKRLVVVIGLLILRIKNEPKAWRASPSTENGISSTEYSPSHLF